MKKKHIFLNDVNSIQIGESLNFENRNTNTSLIINSYGTANSMTFNVTGKVYYDGPELQLQLMEVNNLNNGLIDDGTLDGVYEVINASAFKYINVSITAIQGGNATIVGEVFE